MNISAANIGSVVRLPSTNDEQRQPYDRGRASRENDDANRRPASPESTEYVFRGEVIESVENDKRYSPRLNQQIDPQNREAISNYQSTSIARVEAQPLGRVIDRFV